ncbi:bifunctional enoyl-CoA hydratase/phosphate acetyltransferase [Croceicoccus mobilis]|uniref:Bifunctional enoyl-CoA hydratase/phosphate acetyltransferase n=1 Tax=Croceicoccus mobilis TaxID=1703339 RepID=A0A916YYP3_9SPHN|nr:bifunctional enoyl-CoA hydratase/phosphate acetyltransferase [Croceicoccus mobilis]GGD66147.1 bifunctional enoyl-CoA hydratase/phosphate acetyltransferase [Croceicoccus mobilis]
MHDTATIENRTFDEISVGDSASVSRTLTERDIQLFALASGDVNPAHMDPEYAEGDMFHHVIAHGLWGGGLISAVLGTELPGPGTIYLGQSFRFLKPVSLGDHITATVTVKEKREKHHALTLDCQCTNQRGEAVITGEAEVMAPTEKIRRKRVELPRVVIPDHDVHAALVKRCRGGEPVPTAIVHPCSAVALSAALEAAEAGMIVPILVGPQVKIESVAQEAGIDISGLRIEAAPHSHAAAARGVDLVISGEARLLMKGSLHTDELMHAVLDKTHGLRTERRLSHVYVMDVPGHEPPLLISDAAINVAPTLMEKADIIRNAIDVAHVIGIETPRVAILSASETVMPVMESTLDAAALCKMADRGQITGGVLDGPLAFDNAISAIAAREKGIVSPVAGNAEILIVPTLEAGNMLAKELTFLAGADAAGIVLGARVPIILTSRADSERTRIASCALGVLLSRAGTLAAPGLAE